MRKFNIDQMVDEATNDTYEQLAIPVAQPHLLTIRIVIPDVPESQNQMYMNKLHYHQRSQEKKRWEQYVRMFSTAVRPPRALHKATITLRYWFPTNKRRDPDNYSGKFILDGLVKSGIIMDDSFEHIKLLIEKGGVDKKFPRTEIIVVEEE